MISWLFCKMETFTQLKTKFPITKSLSAARTDKQEVLLTLPMTAQSAIYSESSRYRCMCRQVQQMSWASPKETVIALLHHSPGKQESMVRRTQTWQKEWGSHPGLCHLLSVTLGKLINASKCLFPHLQNEGSNHNCFIGLLWRLNVMMAVNGKISTRAH